MGDQAGKRPMPRGPSDGSHGGVIEVVIGVLVAMREGEQRVLIARRRHDTVLAGYWEMPGGKVEHGESHDNALRREFSEELDIIVRVGDALPVIEHVYDHGHVRLHPYLCTHVTGEPRNVEVAEHRWITPAELTTVRFPPANAPLVEHLIDTL